MILCRGDGVDPTSLLSIRSSMLREHIAQHFTVKPLRGCGCVFVWFVMSDSLVLFWSDSE